MGKMLLLWTAEAVGEATIAGGNKMIGQRIDTRSLKFELDLLTSSDADAKYPAQ
jgi:hypothetical protein